MPLMGSEGISRKWSQNAICAPHGEEPTPVDPPVGNLPQANEAQVLGPQIPDYSVIRGLAREMHNPGDLSPAPPSQAPSNNSITGEWTVVRVLQTENAETPVERVIERRQEEDGSVRERVRAIGVVTEQANRIEQQVQDQLQANSRVNPGLPHVGWNSSDVPNRLCTSTMIPWLYKLRPR